MTSETKRIWGIRAGKLGRAHNDFVNKGMVVLADACMGDLNALNGTRAAFYSKYRESHPDDTKSGASGIAGKFFRFRLDMRKGDLVAYPALTDKQVYIGVIIGEYSFVAGSAYPHQRNVRWKYVIPKSEFSTQAAYELGAARTLFEVKRNSNELLRRISSDGVTHFKAKTKSKSKA